MSLEIGIVGGGINGLCAAWLIAQDGHKVTVYERDTLMSATSRASSKLLHGGLRYLENREFRLVREALKERDDWFNRCPNLAKPLQLLIPIYKSSKRSRWHLALGLGLYNFMASSQVVPCSKWHDRESALNMSTGLKSQDLIGAYSFWDGQMDDYALGLWVAEQAVALGVQIRVGVEVQQVSVRGDVLLNDGQSVQHDRVLNFAGPWAERLSQNSGIQLRHKLDLVRGSHIILNRKCSQACLLEVPGEKRIFFVLPWQGQTMVGTTEVRQSLDNPIECSVMEREYLLNAYRHYFPGDDCKIQSDFSGLRPLIQSAKDPSQATREYVIETHDRLLTVLGGKWTTSMALAKKVKEKVVNK